MTIRAVSEARLFIEHLLCANWTVTCFLFPGSRDWRGRQSPVKVQSHTWLGLPGGPWDSWRGTIWSRSREAISELVTFNLRKEGWRRGWGCMLRGSFSTNIIFWTISRYGYQVLCWILFIWARGRLNVRLWYLLTLLKLTGRFVKSGNMKELKIARSCRGWAGKQSSGFLPPSLPQITTCWGWSPGSLLGFFYHHPEGSWRTWLDPAKNRCLPFVVSCWDGSQHFPAALAGGRCLTSKHFCPAWCLLSRSFC